MPFLGEHLWSDIPKNLNEGEETEWGRRDICELSRFKSSFVGL